MSLPGDKFLDLRFFEDLSRQNSPVHQLAPEAKILITLAFLILALSWDKYEISGLLPFFLYPVVLLRMGSIPVEKILARSLIVLPFVFFIGIFNPLLDTVPRLHIGELTLSGGWLSFFSLILRGYLTALMALTLISTTGFPHLCAALGRMGVPSALTTQLLFLYHSLFVMGDEAGRMYDSWKNRSFGNKKMPFKAWASLVGHLLLRSFDRSGRLHLALLSRGFNGKLLLSKPSCFRFSDALFLVGSIGVFCLFRFTYPTAFMGQFIERFFS